LIPKSIVCAKTEEGKIRQISILAMIFEYGLFMAFIKLAPNGSPLYPVRWIRDCTCNIGKMKHWV